LIDLNERTTPNHTAIDMHKSESRERRERGEEKGEKNKETNTRPDLTQAPSP